VGVVVNKSTDLLKFRRTLL